MKNQWYLDKALELSPERAAFRVGPTGDLWEVRQEKRDTSYTLIHLFNSTGYPGDPLVPETIHFRTLDDLLGAESRLNAWLSNNDWYPYNDETRKMFPTLNTHANDSV